MRVDVAVVGAGIAGLTCARQLVEVGKSVLVVEKSRGVGGRCASRRIDDSVVDHGITFYHGVDEKLRAALEVAGADRVLSGWPRKIRGSGAPCQPSAFRAGDWRLAFERGVTAFPKWLAKDLDVRLNWSAVTIAPEANRWRVVSEGGEAVTARDLVLTFPTPQALRLLGPRCEESREFESLRALLEEIGFVPALTVIALYPSGGPEPDWDMCYPEDSAILQLVSHDSSKRPRPHRTALVLQALPAWSRKQWERPQSEWSKAMLAEGGRLVGSWAATPETISTHRWRFARVASGGDLSGPLMIGLPGGRRMGFAGDGFSPGGGVQAAWRSGRALAARFLEDQAT